MASPREPSANHIAPPDGRVEAPKRFHDEAWHTPGGRVVRELVFGVNDGVISTVGFLAGVTATLADARAIGVAGLASAIAGSSAMGIGAYVSAKSQRAFFQAEIAREAWEIEHMPDHERQEIRDIYRALGFSPEECEMIVRRVTSSPELWLRFMSREELGLSEETFDPPARVGALTGLAYAFGAGLLLLPYAFGPAPRRGLAVAVVVAVVTLLITGAAKTWLTKESPWRASLELAALGMLACAIGLALGRLVGVAV
ncbi:MAG TPA: VIT1/CCC1 transporter family protein [Candidatus Binatia bacterium]|nr:VIT1/CCC1 transporter family protein [Candidatus Binatia bacterium]